MLTISLTDDNLLSMDDDVSHSVDALVAESVSETGASPFHHGLSMPSRTSTPSVPPGFNLPHAHPSPTRDDAMAKPQTRIPAIPAPSQYTPPRSMTATHVPRVGTPLSTVSIPPRLPRFQQLLSRSRVLQRPKRGSKQKKTLSHWRTTPASRRRLLLSHHNPWHPQGFIGKIFQY
jgi:hypothetical protein